MLSSEISIKTQRLLQRKLSEYFAIEEHDPCTGLNNYIYGDAQYKLVNDTGRQDICNVDYKKISDNYPYIPIELIQVSYHGQYDSWLYNDNIKLVVYEYKQDAFCFSHNTLKAIAANYFDDEQLWDTCIIYSRNAAAFTAERDWIRNKLVGVAKKLDIGLTPNPSGFHINGCFNYSGGQKRHSGFCINIPIQADYVQQKKL